jgi:hypothetical protein
MKITTPRPETAAQFVAALSTLQISMPLTSDPKNPGTVIDAGGTTVLVVDPDSERPDSEAHQLAEWIVLAVNTCGGFRLEMDNIE